MKPSDHEYFSRRAAEERAAAKRTDCPFAQRSHLELAQRYDAAAAASLGAPVVQFSRRPQTRADR
jgi:hypothetical protein